MTRPPGGDSPASSAARPPRQWPRQPTGSACTSTRVTLCSAISAPTLVIHRTGDPSGQCRPRPLPRRDTYAEPDSPSIPGDFHESAQGKDEEVLDEIEEFLTGTRQEYEIDRVLKTILFTDIVGSTRTGRAHGGPTLARAPRGPRLGSTRRARAVPRPRGEDDGRRVPRGLRRTGPGDPLRAGDHRQGRGHRTRGPNRAAHRRMHGARR